MTIHHLVRILTVRKWWIVGSVAVFAALALAFLVLTPKRYMAVASVVVNTRGSDPLALGTSQGQGGLSATTQAEIVKRPRVARQVVADLGLDRDPQVHKSGHRVGRHDREPVRRQRDRHPVHVDGPEVRRANGKCVR